ncbi:unnamed protein product [Linum tenue]|uniref:Cation/H+ exchanger domain-containing protein n=1 Tax=Linum tenue TaxID=586396 RepID=A0AAV0IPY7_9ROSI|nr:unnamed protein product [Linum tenue]CAI0399706.1 unnamed protein product [Linum tenue]
MPLEIQTPPGTYCAQIPRDVDFSGVWQNQTSRQILMHPLPTLQLQLVLIFFFAQAIHLLLLAHLGLPTIVSQLLVGILLGPSFIGGNDKFKELMFTIESQEVLGLVATLGYMLLIFTIAVKMDVKMVLSTGKRATLVGVLSVLAPLVFGLFVESLIEKILKINDLDDNFPFVTLIVSITPFPVIAKILGDLQILNSELGRLTLSAAMVGDMGSVALTTIVTMSSPDVHISVGQFGFILYTAMFIFFAAFVFRPAMFWIIDQTPKGGQVQEKYICGIMVAVFASGVITHLFGQYALFGPFILGLAIPEGPPLGTALADRLDCITSYVIQPLFVAIAGMRTDFSSLKHKRKLIIIDVLLVLATLGAKIVSCFLVSVQGRMPVKDSLAFSLLMSSKGIVELATYSFLRDTGRISEATFTVLNMSILLTAIIVPMAVRRLYDSSRKYANYQRRSISFLRPNSELRVLMSIHSPENIPEMMRLVEAGCPNQEKPVSLYVLHLIKLSGRALPVFISHRIQTKFNKSFSYSENVTSIFDRYQQIHPEGLSVSAFTAISPPESMHEDICTLALDKRTALIVLPFHQSRSARGRILTDDRTVRALNRSVLDRAPCSVGILVDRSHIRRMKKPSFAARKAPARETASASSPQPRVAMIFIGGDDDREALTFAKRMVRGSASASLAVIRLVAKDGDGGLSEWEKILDFEALKEVAKAKHGGGGGEIKVEVGYVEEAVKDGQETSRVLKRVAVDYELIIVGRRNGVVSPQTNGLSEWSEFPELGLVGDLLVSPDLNGGASVLVVQQQKQLK